MADNLQLNAGTGGGTLRTLAESSGVEWPVSVVTYATNLADGANSLQVVTPSAGLPVSAEQAGVWVIDTVIGTVSVVCSDPADLKASVSIASGQTLATLTSITNPVAVTQSGTWSFDIGSPEVSIAPSQSLASVGSITSPVTVVQPTASALNATATLTSGSALIGKASVGQDTASIYSGTTALTPKFAKIAASSSGDNSVVALVSGKKIRVLRWSLSANGTVAAKWRSNTTDATGLHYLIQYASAGGSYSPVGIFETAVGEALQINLSGAVAVGGELTFIEV